jgi:hypothetical protein
MQATLSRHWKTNLKATKVEDICYRLSIQSTPVYQEKIESWRTITDEIVKQPTGVYFFMPYNHESNLHGMAFQRGNRMFNFFDPNFGSYQLAGYAQYPNAIACHLKGLYDNFKNGGTAYIYKWTL